VAQVSPSEVKTALDYLRFPSHPWPTIHCCLQKGREMGKTELNLRCVNGLADCRYGC
jgi:hypothetical protein